MAADNVTAPGAAVSPDSASNMTSSYVKVVLVELVVLAALWWLQHAFL